jgi:hypothetical protein
MIWLHERAAPKDAAFRRHGSRSPCAAQLFLGAQHISALRRSHFIEVMRRIALVESVSYDQVIDMRFVNQVRKELNVQ